MQVEQRAGLFFRVASAGVSSLRRSDNTRKI
jgi:hypothetical protein